MQSITSFFRSAEPADPDAGPSLLSEWHQYNAAPATAPSASTRLLASAEEGAAGVTKFMTQAVGAITTNVHGAATTVQAQVQSAQFIPSSTQWAYFAMLLGSGALFLMLAFFLFLPVLVLAPHKFALTFTLGSMLIISSIGALKTPRAMIQMMLVPERLPSTLAYVGSLVGTLYASLFMHSYLFSLLFCIVQIVTLLYFVASYFPGGSAGAQFVVTGLGRGAVGAGGAIARSIFR